MDISFFSEKETITLDTVAAIERETAEFVFENLNVKNLMKDSSPLALTVAVEKSDTKKESNSTIMALSATVSIVYGSTNTQQLMLENILYYATNKETTKDIFTFSKEAVNLTFDGNDSNVTMVRVIDDGMRETDFALMMSTSILSVMLVLVSSILLYLSGAWDACRERCVNCLFEEVDDEFVLTSKPSMAPTVQKTYEEDEENSVTTSPAPTTASGLLGAQNQINPLAGLGIKTPGRYDSESVATYDYDDIGMTPRSEATNQMPLGITSMRKLPQPESPDAQSGLRGLIMQRFANKSPQKL